MISSQTIHLVREQSLARPSNKLLAALPRDEYDYLVPELEYLPVEPKQILQRPGEEVTHVFFPGHGICSLMELMRDGAAVEVGLVGGEGMIGGPSWAAETNSGSVETRVRVRDDAMCMIKIDALEKALKQCARFTELIGRYSRAFLRFTLQLCACNALHGVDERCCRWLLMMRDRAGQDELQLTHDTVASALGVRRPTVTLTINALRNAGLLQTRRGRIIIQNRQGLEAAACECYAAIKTSFENVSEYVPA